MEKQRNTNKTKGLTLQNPRTGEVWICEDYTNRRLVDGVEFIEVHQPGSNRMVWIANAALVKTRVFETVKK